MKRQLLNVCALIQFSWCKLLYDETIWVSSEREMDLILIDHDQLKHHFFPKFLSVPSPALGLTWLGIIYCTFCDFSSPASVICFKHLSSFSLTWFRWVLMKFPLLKLQTLILGCIGLSLDAACISAMLNTDLDTQKLNTPEHNSDVFFPFKPKYFLLIFLQ